MTYCKWMLPLAAAAAMAVQFGCAPAPAPKTEPAPVPQVQALVPAAVRGKRVAVAMDVQETQIKGGHHEGLLKVRQPWIFGLKPEQKALLYDNAAQVAALAFSAELQQEGLVVDPAKAEFTLAGTVQTVTLNTYGHGTVEGLGSAGDYWEATVAFSQVRLTENRTGRVLYEGQPTGYARLSPCPAHLDWTNLDVLTKSLKGAMILSKLKTVHDPSGLIKGGKDYLYNFEGTYTLDKPPVTPIDLAGRQAAASMLAQVVWR